MSLLFIRNITATLLAVTLLPLLIQLDCSALNWRLTDSLTHSPTRHLFFLWTRNPQESSRMLVGDVQTSSFPKNPDNTTDIQRPCESPPIASCSRGYMYLRVYTTKKLNYVALVREWSISTERPPHVGEVSAKFCGLSRGQRNGSPWPSISIF
jgi:hypothetical protein